MLDIEKLVRMLESKGVDFFTGVPDSFLNGFCDYMERHIPRNRHIIAANEGNAIALAAGHYLASGQIPLVYMQNSGVGNALNPLLSMTDEYVYGIPMLLLIGWRGEPGIGDHAQHHRQGDITLGLLELCGIPHMIVDEQNIEEQIIWAVSMTKQCCSPVALIARKGIFAPKEKINNKDSNYPLSRKEAIRVIMDNMPKETFYAATTGRTTRELFYLREERNEVHDRDYLNVGAMGHASSVALGMALAQEDMDYVCLDGDAAVLMHMGSMAIIGESAPEHFLHIVLNNGAHESVGGQKSAGFHTDFTSIAKSVGYQTYGHFVETQDEIEAAIRDYRKKGGPYLIEVRIHKGLSDLLPALDASCADDKEKLMKEFAKAKGYE